MPQHIVNLGDMVIDWIEDQPVIRNVRKQIEQNGLIRDLINELKSSGKSQIQKNKKYQDPSHQMKDYICLVVTYSSTESDPTNPQYRVAIRPSSNIPNEWDAIGDVYVEHFPDIIAVLLKEE